MVQDSVPVQGVKPVAQRSGTNDITWRSSMQLEHRRELVQTAFEYLKTVIPCGKNEVLKRLEGIAKKIEAESYSVATCKKDYIERINLMLKDIRDKSRNIASTSGPGSVSQTSSSQNSSGVAQDSPANPWGPPKEIPSNSLGNSERQSKQQKMNIIATKYRSQSMACNKQSFHGIHKPPKIPVPPHQIRKPPKIPVLPHQIEPTWSTSLHTQSQPSPQSLSSQTPSQQKQVSEGDYKEEIYQKMICMRDKYLHRLHKSHQKVTSRIQHLNSLPYPFETKHDNLKLANHDKSLVEAHIQFLQIQRINKNKIEFSDWEIVNEFERKMEHILNLPEASIEMAQIDQPVILNSNLTIATNTIDLEQHSEAFVRLVKSMSGRSLKEGVSDIMSVVNLVDRMGCSAPGNGSTSEIGEDLAAKINQFSRSNVFPSESEYAQQCGESNLQLEYGIWENLVEEYCEYPKE